MSDFESLLQDYETNKSMFQSLEAKMKLLIKDILKIQCIRVHSVTGRVKERHSLEKKILVKNKYSSLLDITDIVGVRIITNLEEDVDKVAEAIKLEFNVDDRNSIDKRKKESDRFGYSSLHYIVAIKDTRNSLLEYSVYKNIKFEIQIRSILQHAWAEIEHDTGYKSKDAIPDVARRSFSRLAALLEIADLEFSRLKNSLDQYQSTVAQEILSNAINVELNKISLISYYATVDLVKAIENEVATHDNIAIDESDCLTDELVLKLKYIGIDNIKLLEENLITRSRHLVDYSVAYVKRLCGESSAVKVAKGASLMHLTELIAIEKGDEFFKMYMETFWRSGNLQLLTDVIINAYKDTVPT